MPEIPLRLAKKLCTATEFRAVRKSVGTALERPEAELRRSLALLRKMRDKWRTQATSQRRRLRPSRGGDAQMAASRSAEKGRIFDEAMARIEARLVQRPDAWTTPLGRSRAGAKRRRRATEHRRTRATTRSALQNEIVDSGATRRGAGAKPLRPKGARAGADRGGAGAHGAAAAASAGTRLAKRLGTAKGKKGKGAKSRIARVAMLGGANLGLSAAAGPELIRRPQSVKGSSRAAARPGAVLAEKKVRIRIRGLDTRVRGHVSAEVRRKQAKRDAQQARAREA